MLRVSLTSFENGGRTWPSGTLFVPRTGNLPELENLVENLTTEAEVLADRDGWYQIRTPDGEASGWIFGQFLSEQSPG